MCIRDSLFTLPLLPDAVVHPAENTPLTVLLQLALFLLPDVKSPKSVPFPNVAIVIYSIILVIAGVFPPPCIPRVVLEAWQPSDLAVVNSPKLSASPFVAKVEYDIAVITEPVSPPHHTTLVGDCTPDEFLIAVSSRTVPKLDSVPDEDNVI